MPDEPLLTTTQAAKAIGVGARTLARWAHEKTIRPTLTTAGGHHRWRLDDLRRQLSELTERED